MFLKRKKGVWLLNGKEEARKAAISFLIATLEGIEPKSPLSATTFEELSGKSPVIPVLVRVFSGKRKVRSFAVYHFNDTDYGSVLRKSSRSKPYLIYLPGYDFSAGSVFTAEEDYWRPFTIFEIMPSEIKLVAVDYPGETERSFVLENKNGTTILHGAAVFDSVAVKRYLSYFVNVPFESVTTGLDLTGETQIMESAPFIAITVSTNDGKKHTLRGWKRYSGKETDTDRLWGRLDNGKLFVMRYFDLDPLLKKRSYFLMSK